MVAYRGVRPLTPLLLGVSSPDVSQKYSDMQLQRALNIPRRWAGCEQPRSPSLSAAIWGQSQGPVQYGRYL